MIRVEDIEETQKKIMAKALKRAEREAKWSYSSVKYRLKRELKIAIKQCEDACLIESRIYVEAGWAMDFSDYFFKSVYYTKLQKYFKSEGFILYLADEVFGKSTLYLGWSDYHFSEFKNKIEKSNVKTKERIQKHKELHPDD